MKRKILIVGMVFILAAASAAATAWVDRTEIVARAESESGEEVMLSHMHSEAGGLCYHHHSGDSASGGGCYTVPTACGGSITAKTHETYCGTWNAWYGPNADHTESKWWATCSSCGTLLGPHGDEITGYHMKQETYYSCDSCGTRYDGGGTCAKVSSYDAGCDMDEQVLDCAEASCGSYHITCNDTTVGMESTSLTAYVTSQGAGAAVTSYQWSTGETSQTITVMQNGTYSCEITYTDQKSGTALTAGASYTVANLDNTPPEVTLSYTPSAPTNEGTTIHVSATDNVGVTGYSFDGITFSAVQERYVTVNGTYTVYATDAAGNIGSSTITVDNIDQVAPEIVSVTKSTEGRYINGALRVQIIAQDVVSEGYAREISVQYSADGYNWSDRGEFSLTIDGTQEILIRDAAGNISTTSVSIAQDTTPPRVSGTQTPQSWTKDAVCLTVTAADDQSGIPEWAYKWADGDWNPASQFYVTANGYYPVTVRDAAGNTASYTFHVTQIDRTAPMAEVGLAVSDWHDGPNIILVQASDQESGLAESAYSYDGGATWTDAAEYEITAGGDYLVLVRDAAGNITEGRIHAEKAGIETNIDIDDTGTQHTAIQWHKKQEEQEEAPLTMVQTAAIPVQPTVWQKYTDVPVAHSQETIVPKIIVSISIPTPAAAAQTTQTAENAGMTGSEEVKGTELQFLRIAAICGICLGVGGLILFFFLLMHTNAKKAALCKEHDGKYHVVDRIKVNRLGDGKGYTVEIHDKRICEQITEHITGQEWHYMLRFDSRFAKRHESENLKILLCNGSLINTTIAGEVEFL